MSEKELLSAAEAAQKMRITKRTLLRWARENQIESVRLSRKVVLFAAEAIDEFVKGRARKVETAPMNQRETGRITASPKSTKRGGGKKNSGELWSDLRKEVRQWQ